MELIKMVKYTDKIDKKKESEEDLDLEKYLEWESERERRMYDLIRDFLDFKSKMPPIPIMFLRKPPIVKLRFKELDTSIDPDILERLGIKPKKDNKKKMKIEWRD